MKRILPFLLLLISIISARAQTNEVAVQVSSGLFSYGGKSASATSDLYISDIASQPYEISKPFGTKSAFSYGLGIQAQHITKRNFIWGISAGYDQLSARTQIKNSLTMGGNFPVSNGKARQTTNSIHANPYFGYRIPVNKIKVDFTAGLNVAFITKSYNYVTFDGQSDFFAKKSENTRINTKTDFGPVAGLAVSYKRLGVSASYIHGLINYQRMMDGANPEVYSRYLRLGISYRIF
jgi:hypothetical protein